MLGFARRNGLVWATRGAIISGEDPREHDADVRRETADERDRIADRRDLSADQRDADAERRGRLADAIEAALREMVSDPSDGLLDDLAANAGERARNAAAQQSERDRAGSAAAGPPSDGGALEADRRDFVADDREDHADLLEALQDEAERLADAREEYLRALAAEVGLRAAAGATGAEVAWPRPSERQDREAGGEERAQAAAARHAANIARDDAHRSALAAQLVAITQALVRSRNVDAVLADVVEAARRVVPGCDAATFTAFRAGSLVTIASTAEAAAALDAAQYATGEGPSIEAVATMAIVRSDDLTAEARWPGLRGQLPMPAFCSVLSAGVADERRLLSLGCLNLYRTSPGGFREDDEESAILLAAHLGAVLSLASSADEADARVGQLSDAVQTRDVIGQAKGILMERKRLTPEQAFDVLVRASQALNRKLRDVAEDLTRTGSLDSAQ